MKKFILKILLFLTCFFAIVHTIKWFAPYHWGNVWYSTKIQHLEKTPEQYNTFFFGSSRIYRQVNPHTFDSIVGKSLPSSKSFNLGAPATFCPQTYWLLNRFLQSEISHKARTVFIELMDVMPIEEDLMHQERTTYWVNAAELNFIRKVIAENEQLGKLNKLKMGVPFLSSYIENQMGAGQFKDEWTSENYYNPMYLGSAKNGFFALEEEQQLSTDRRVLRNLAKSRKLVNEKTLRSMAAVSEMNDSSTVQTSPTHVQRIKQLIAQCSKRSIRVIFVVTPRTVHPQVRALYKEIPEANKIDVCSYSHYPEFYAKENTFDNAHLNTHGSEMLTVKLAEEYLKLKQK